MKNAMRLLVLVTICSSASAHHSFAALFDGNSKQVVVTGAVRDFQFKNPHGIITLLVKENAREVIWKAETNSVSGMRRNGWRKDSLQVGETITMQGWRARDGRPYMRLRAARRANGEPIGKAVFNQND